MRSPYVGVPDAAGLIIGSESVLTGLTGTLVRFRSDHEFGTQVQRVRMELPATDGRVDKEADNDSATNQTSRRPPGSRPRRDKESPPAACQQPEPPLSVGGQCQNKRNMKVAGCVTSAKVEQPKVTKR